MAAFGGGDRYCGTKTMSLNLESYFDRLWPLCRSITGNGLRDSLKILQEIIPLELVEIPTGTKAFDWEVPKEWNIRDAYIITPDGKKICNFKENNLHLLNYSIPQDREISYEELKDHLFTRPDLPEAIPYVTSYYKENWGFCLSHKQLQELPQKGTYKIFIDAELKAGHLTYGHLVLKGETEKEVLFSTYLCHPSMANNELSGPLAMASLYQKIAALKKRKYTYRFVIAPETIGIIVYLAKYGAHIKKHLEAGYILTCCGDRGALTYKRSKKENTLADRVAERVLKQNGIEHSVIPFAIGGSDERQYCSPGFDLPVGSFIRTPYHTFKEYHTSLDNKAFISFNCIEETAETLFDCVKEIESSRYYINMQPDCEPQLGKRGLYPTTGGTWGDISLVHKMLHMLAFADGRTDLTEIAAKKGLKSEDLTEAIQKLSEAGLLRET